MKKVLSSFVFSVAVLSTLPAWADADLKQTFEKKYRKMEMAMESHDVQAINQLLTPDFTSVDIHGKKIDSAEMIKATNKLPVDSNRQSTTIVEQVDVKDDTALVVQSYNMKTIQVLSDGKVGSVDFKAVSHDTWVKMGDNWLLKETTTNSMDYFIDGKNIMHQVK